MSDARYRVGHLKQEDAGEDGCISQDTAHSFLDKLLSAFFLGPVHMHSSPGRARAGEGEELVLFWQPAIQLTNLLLKCAVLHPTPLACQAVGG